MAAVRAISQRELNRALLARQFLLERSSLPLVETLERIGGLQTQYAPSGYIGLWSRLNNFQRGALTSALERRQVIQGTLLRSTIHMVSARDYPLFLAAVKEARQEWWRRTRKEFGAIDMEAAIAAFREHLGSGPRRASELRELLATRGYPPIAWNGVAQWVDMVRVPPSGTWDQRRADLYALPERFRPLVFNTKTPHSKPTFLVDGAVAGSWRYEGGGIKLEPFEPLPRRVREEVEAEAGRLAAFQAD